MANWRPGFYKTISGKTVEILAVRDEIIIGWCEGEAETWNSDGSYLYTSGGAESSWDLMPERHGE